MEFERDFDYFWGTLAGAGSLFALPTSMCGDSAASADRDDFLHTDEITDRAVWTIEELAAEDTRFFSQVACALLLAKMTLLQPTGQNVIGVDSHLLAHLDAIGPMRR